MKRAQLVEMIHANKERIAGAWCQEIQNCEYMKTYHGFRDDELIHRNERVLEHVANSLEAGTSRIESGKFFVVLGKERFRENFPLCEVNYALFLTKKVLWKRMHTDGLLASALDLYQALELMNAICDFFDLASFYLIRGYTEEMHHKLARMGKLSANELRDIFSPGSFFYDGTRFDDEFQKIPFFDWHW